MKSQPQDPKPALKPVAVFLAALGLATVFSAIFSPLTCSIGLSFSGLDGILTFPVAIFFSAIVTTIATVCLKETVKRFGWRMVLLLAPFLALLSFAAMSWMQACQHLRIIMAPSDVPKSVRIQHGKSVMFGSYVHFTASPSDISTLIRSKELIEVPDWNTDSESDMPAGFPERERHKSAWDWWQPAPGARFYYRPHQGQAQGWIEGWWVNDKTNEVYAYING
jgi:hypothetical protein